MPALLTHSLGAEADAGTAVRAPLLATLNNAQATAMSTDDARSNAKTIINPQDERIEKALRCIVHLLRARHPNDWEQVLRSWEWRKTSF